MANYMKQLKTIPNILSVIRIIIIPIFVVLFIKEYYTWAVFALALSGLSDMLDGKIARRFNQVTDLGKMLDPVADKLTEVAIAIVLILKYKDNKILMFLFSLFIIKEALMLVGGWFLLSKGLRPGAAEIWGKVSTLVFYFVMIFIFAFGKNGAFSDLWEMNLVIMYVSVGISAVLTFVALGSYLPGFFKLLSSKKS